MTSTSFVGEGLYALASSSLFNYTSGCSPLITNELSQLEPAVHPWHEYPVRSVQILARYVAAVAITILLAPVGVAYHTTALIYSIALSTLNTQTMEQKELCYRHFKALVSDALGLLSAYTTLTLAGFNPIACFFAWMPESAQKDFQYGSEVTTTYAALRIRHYFAVQLYTPNLSDLIKDDSRKTQQKLSEFSTDAKSLKKQLSALAYCMPIGVLHFIDHKDPCNDVDDLIQGMQTIMDTINRAPPFIHQEPKAIWNDFLLENIKKLALPSSSAMEYKIWLKDFQKYLLNSLKIYPAEAHLQHVNESFLQLQKSWQKVKTHYEFAEDIKTADQVSPWPFAYLISSFASLTI